MIGNTPPAKNGEVFDKDAYIQKLEPMGVNKQSKDRHHERVMEVARLGMKKYRQVLRALSNSENRHQ